jgi:hypothetical protein
MHSPPSFPLPRLFLVLALFLCAATFPAAAAEADRTAAVINEDGSTTTISMEEERKEEGQRALKLGTLHSLAVLHFLR